MDDKIAVRCLTKGMWNEIQAKIRETTYDWNPGSSCWDEYKSDTCVAPIGTFQGSPGFANTDYWLSKGYKIVSAETYLGLHPLTAIECTSKESWNTVQKAMFEKGKRWQAVDGNDSDELRDLFEERECCCLTEHGINGRIQVSSKEFWIKRGYKIISAEKYLGPPKKIRKIGSLGIDFNTIVKRT